MSDVELTPVRPQHRFDEGALRGYMEEHIEGFEGPFTVLQFEGGQSNPTFLVQARDRPYVMRKQPPGELLPSAHAVDREYRVMDALYDTPVPVPQMHSLCEDRSVLGAKFYVMEMVEGRLYTRTALPDVERDERREIYLEMARHLAHLHAVNPAAVGLGNFGRPGNYFGRQINRWSRQYRASETETIEAMNRLMDWLPENLPAQTPPVIVHGDYRLGNVLLHPTEPRVVAILDWELSTLGDGLADLGYWCQEYYGSDESGPQGESSVAHVDLAAWGIPDERELVAAYCDFAGRGAIDNWPFYIVYNLFRSAGIIQGVYKRGLDGNASSEKALEYAGVARARAERGWGLLSGGD